MSTRGEYIAAYDRYRRVYGSDDEDNQVWRDWHNLLDPRDPESLAKGLQGYACLFDEQEHILNSGHDYQSLLAGLERLPTLTTLRVQDDFYFGDWLPFYDDADDWYEKKTARDFVGCCRLQAGTLGETRKRLHLKDGLGTVEAFPIFLKQYRGIAATSRGCSLAHKPQKRHWHSFTPLPPFPST